MNKNIVCWFEIYVKDLERAKKFYTEVLGTSFVDQDTQGDAPQHMKMSFFSSPENQGISGALIAMGGKEGSDHALNTIVYFPCVDCAVEASRVEVAGGKVKDAKKSIGEYGYISICIDTEGNIFGLFSMQ